MISVPRGVGMSTMRTQGSRARASKVRQQFPTEGMIQSRAKAIALETGCGRMRFEQVESNMAHDGQVLGSVVQAQARSILGKGDRQSPVKSMFNRPVSASRIEEALGLGR